MIVTTIMTSSSVNAAALMPRLAGGIRRRTSRKPQTVMGKCLIVLYQSLYLVPSIAVAWD